MIAKRNLCKSISQWAESFQYNFCVHTWKSYTIVNCTFYECTGEIFCIIAAYIFEWYSIDLLVCIGEINVVFFSKRKKKSYEIQTEKSWLIFEYHAGWFFYGF